MRCYECFHWQKRFGTEKVGECRVEGPGLMHGSEIAVWPVTGKDENCSRFAHISSADRDSRMISLDEIVRNFSKGSK